MKNALALTALVSSLLFAAPAAVADEMVTLNNYADEITLKKGEVALVVTTSQDVVVQYERKDTWPRRKSQFNLVAQSATSYGVRSHKNDRYREKSFIPSWDNPFPLVGPCKIKLMTSGVIGLRVVTNEG